MNFQTQYNREQFPDRGHEINRLPSLTLPDQSMTVLEILQRHTVGLPVNMGLGVPIYEGEHYLPDLDKMDFVDRQDAIDMAKEQAAALKSKFDVEAKEKAEKARARRAAQFNAPNQGSQAPASPNNPNPGKNSAGGNQSGSTSPSGL